MKQKKSSSLSAITSHFDGLSKRISKGPLFPFNNVFLLSFIKYEELRNIKKQLNSNRPKLNHFMLFTFRS